MYKNVVLNNLSFYPTFETQKTQPFTEVSNKVQLIKGLRKKLRFFFAEEINKLKNLKSYFA